MLRGVLFQEGKLTIGTPTHPAALYKPVISAFEDVIKALDRYVKELSRVAHTGN